jgi:hypothetical protein
MAKVWFSRLPPGGHKIGQIAKIKKALGILPKAINTRSFIEVAPADTKLAFPTDDDDGCHVIATAWAKKPPLSLSKPSPYLLITSDFDRTQYFHLTIVNHSLYIKANHIVEIH